MPKKPKKVRKFYIKIDDDQNNPDASLHVGETADESKQVSYLPNDALSIIRIIMNNADDSATILPGAVYEVQLDIIKPGTDYNALTTACIDELLATEAGRIYLNSALHGYRE